VNAPLNASTSLKITLRTRIAAAWLACLSQLQVLSLASRLTAVFLFATLFAIIASALISSSARHKQASLSSLADAALVDMVRAFKASGRDGADSVHDQWRQARNVNVYLLVNGLRINSRPLPDEALEVIAQSNAGVAHAASNNWEILTTRSEASSRDALYVVVLYRHLPLRLSFAFDRSIYWQLLAVFLLISAASVFIALRFTKPLRIIQSTIARVANGQLDARAPQEVLVRHDEFGTLAKRVNQMTTHIERLIQERERVLRHASHELRSPLMRLRLSLELIKQQKMGRDGNTQIDRCNREIDRMDTMIEELLAAARSKHNCPRVVFGELDLMQLLAQCVDTNRMEAQATSINISLRSGARSPALIWGNAELLMRAIDNLLRNAIRFSPRGGQIEIKLKDEATRYLLTVIDSGSGVPEEHVSAIFEPFFQIPSAHNHRGHGLGLSLVRDIVKLHHGNVWARNTDGGFCVSILINKIVVGEPTSPPNSAVLA
jgi:signal transduction histidine kinase